MSNPLNETADRLAVVRAAIHTADLMRAALKDNAERHFNIALTLSWHLNPNASRSHDTVLNYALRDRLRANLDHGLLEAHRDLRHEEAKLCEELIRLAAKTAAGGLR